MRLRRDRSPSRPPRPSEDAGTVAQPSVAHRDEPGQWEDGFAAGYKACSEEERRRRVREDPQKRVHL